MRTVVVKVVN